MDCWVSHLSRLCFWSRLLSLHVMWEDRHLPSELCWERRREETTRNADQLEERRGSESGGQDDRRTGTRGQRKVNIFKLLFGNPYCITRQLARTRIQETVIDLICAQGESELVRVITKSLLAKRMVKKQEPARLTQHYHYRFETNSTSWKFT